MDPTAEVRLEQGRTSFSWVVDHCPHCGKRHWHGGGPLTGDPRSFLSHRVGHCRTGGSQGYTLVERKGDDTNG